MGKAVRYNYIAIKPSAAQTTGPGGHHRLARALHLSIVSTAAWNNNKLLFCSLITTYTCPFWNAVVRCSHRQRTDALRLDQKPSF